VLVVVAMTRQTSTVLVSAILLALVVGALLNYCVQREAVERDEPPTPYVPTVVVLPAAPTVPVSPTVTETPQPDRVPSTPAATSTSTPVPTETPVPPTATETPVVPIRQRG
jgi:hypothetical protein